MTLVHKLIGDTSTGKTRNKNDFYPTPSYVTDALLDNETFDGLIWEPAAGDGAIAKRLEARGYQVKSTDLNDYGYPPCETGVDFLKQETTIVDNVVTNPPFNIGTEFTLHSLKVAKKKVAIFHKLAFLEGITRRQKIFNLGCLQTVYVFSKRVGFVMENGKSGGMMAFAWFVWDKSYQGDPSIKWL